MSAVKAPEDRPVPDTADPAVIDVEISGDQVLATYENEDVSVVIAAPVGVGAEELDAAIAGAPESIEHAVGSYGRQSE